MIIGNLKRRGIAICLLLGILLLSVCGCQPKTEEFPFESLSWGDEDEKAQITLCRVVVSATCSAELWGKAQELGARITEITAIPTEIVYDKEALGNEKECVEILLGRVERTESQKALSRLKREDYLCQAQGKVLILGGKSDAATCAAVDRFCREILPAATARGIMNENGGFLHRAEYAIQEITLNGIPLEEYAIVYDASMGKELGSLAYALREKIAQESGYDLEVRSEKEYKEDQKRILLGGELPEMANDAAYVIPDSLGLMLYAQDDFGWTAVAKGFCKLLFSCDAEGRTNLSFIEPTKIPYEVIGLQIASLLAKEELPAQQITQLQELTSGVQSYRPQIVLFGEIPESELTYLEAILQEYIYMGTKDQEWVQAAFQRENSVALQFSLEEQATVGASSAIYRVGSGEERFWLWEVSEWNEATERVDLPLAVKESGEPILVFLHTSIDEEEASLPTVEELAKLYSYTYQKNGKAYAFDCYGTKGVFQVSEHRSEGWYQEITVNQQSPF